MVLIGIILGGCALLIDIFNLYYFLVSLFRKSKSTVPIVPGLLYLISTSLFLIAKHNTLAFCAVILIFLHIFIIWGLPMIFRIVWNLKTEKKVLDFKPYLTDIEVKFIHSVEGGNIEDAKRCIEQGVNVNLKVPIFSIVPTALMIVCYEGNSEMLNFLISGGLNITKDRWNNPALLANKRGHQKIEEIINEHNNI